MEPPIKVNSEIGRLKTVLLHRPGEELEALTPDYMARMLFDDVPYLKVAQQEHDAFASRTCYGRRVKRHRRIHLVPRSWH